MRKETFAISFSNPLAINPDSREPDNRFSTRPTQSVGIVQSFDVKEDLIARQTEAEVNKDPFTHINVGNLRAVQWNLGLYSQSVESLYDSFKKMLNQRLDYFEKTHGSLTPWLIVVASENRLHIGGGDQILVGWKIEVKNIGDGKNGETLKQKLKNLVS